jgi:nitrogen regulation protein NR(I)
MSKILVVDDDPGVLAAFEQVLTEQGHEVITADRGAAALACLGTTEPDLVIMDIRMPGLSGLQTFRQIRQDRPRLPVIIMTGYATMETAIEATKLGAFDYHVKPLNPEEMLRTVDSALECVRLMAREVKLNSEVVSPAEDAIVGQSRAMQEVYKAVGRVAQTDATVLIRGETGTGKELVARAIYHHSLRAHAPLVVLNCAAIPETLLESELFGHERGAFTGAENRRIGKLEQANGGTLFLDEIGDMPLGTQAKLLRVLQNARFQRVGGDEEIRADLRILAATNRDIEAMIAKGHFREDLFHRLRVFTIDIAPLRERAEDIPRLAQYFVAKFAAELGISKPLLSPEALDLLCRHGWPGNVRELEHCLHRVIIVTQGYPIQAADIGRSLKPPAQREPSRSAASEQTALLQIIRDYLSWRSGDSTHSDFMDMAEKALLSEALRLCKGNQTQAARWLGLARPTLKAKMDRYGLRRSSDPPGGV